MNRLLQFLSHFTLWLKMEWNGHFISFHFISFHFISFHFISWMNEWMNEWMNLFVNTKTKQHRNRKNTKCRPDTKEGNASTNRSPTSIQQFYKQTVRRKKIKKEKTTEWKIIITDITHKSRQSSFEARNARNLHNTVLKLIQTVYNTIAKRICITDIYDIMLQ